MSDENSQSEQKTKSSAKSEITQELLDFKKICDSRCTICQSGILKEVHDWRKNGKNYDQIVELARDVHGVIMSAPSLCRHFKGYKVFKTDLATQIIKNDVLDEVTQQSVHIKKTVEILDIVYEKIKKGLIAGTLGVDISDLEKLVKMRYQILNGQDTDDKDLMAIFQKASDDFGLNVEQGVLFKM